MFDGDRGVKVNTGACGALDSGSIPDDRPRKTVYYNFVGQTIHKLFFEAIPIILMIGLIPFLKNDIFLALVYALIIGVSFLIAYDKSDIIFLLFGAVVLFFSEYFFVSTGVEVFIRNSLLGVMPLWLPILWGYAFVAMRRGIVILEHHLR